MINIALSAKLFPLFLEEIYQRDKILTAQILSVASVIVITVKSKVKFITSKISRRGSEIPQSGAITASVYALVQFPTDAILPAYKRTCTPHAGA